ncbi:MAG: serine/threonine protein kinase [Aquabacterium sp.]|uniref:serine/threonine-protein kinase n=1 Tax=Aquabacterium sp. TaxID=1872578 RepID=UPI0025BB51F7|nr:serine/threonine-protein kinase [Aquabacterium sp.]MBI5925478.1 serine/threonine protein kinase [Aquabacterium sp.]
MALWPRLMPLLDEALAQPADQREAWLQRQNLDEDTAAALRQLLADRRELDGGAFMAALPKLEPVPAASASDDAEHGGGQGAHSSQSGLFAGDMLGPYRLIRPLGQGGMSVVWLAERDDGQIRRQVALKMPHAGPGQALLAERLRRERDILASLEHRHIARLYDVGTAPQGLPFMVLEYIEGQSLPAYCDAHQLNIRERLNLFLQVLSAVQYAHTKLVLHRDLKPSNILVNEQGEVKLLDFGIAKLIRDSETGAVAVSTELTQHNGHVLTPDYAAPEQIAGKPLTTASDVYALGVILFELLTGQRPYRLPRGTRGALEEAILATDPRRPSQVWLDADVQTHHPTAVTLSDLATHFHTSPRRLHQLLKGDLDVIVLTALQKQTVRRYATAEAFAQDIQHHLAKEPIAAQPDSRWYRTRKYVQRHAWALSAVGAVMAALSVGLGVALWQAQEARQEAAKANAIKDFLVGLFENGDVEQPDALRKRQQTVEQLLVNSARALGTQLKDQPQVRVELQGVVGGLLHNLAITDEAIALRLQRAEQLTAMNADVGERVQAWRDLADSQDARGDTAAAGGSLNRGYNLCAANQMRPVTLCYGIQVAKAQLLLKARDIRGAQELIAPALQQLGTYAVNTSQHAEALVAMGDLLSLQNDNKASFAKYEESMEIRARLWGTHSARLAQERYQLAMSLAQVGRFSQALQELQDAHRTMATVLGADHVSSAAIELQLGRLSASIGLSGGGRDLVAHASKVILTNLGSVDLRTVFQAHLALGELALFDGRLGEVGQHLTEALRLQSMLGNAVPIDGRIETVMAWYLDDIGRPTEARATLLEARVRLTKRLGEQHPYVLAIDEAVGASYLAEGNLTQATKWLGSPTVDKNAELAASPAQMSTGRTALLMAMGRFNQAATTVIARYEAVDRTPRNDQFRLAIFSASDQMARLKMGQKVPLEARPYFERAIKTLSDGYIGNPYLAATRARYGLCLFAIGDHAGALKQANLAGKAFREQSVVAYHFKEPLDELRKLLATAVATGM